MSFFLAIVSVRASYAITLMFTVRFLLLSSMPVTLTAGVLSCS